MTEITNSTEQLRRDEGEKLHCYKDHLGYATIGVGRLIDQRRGGGITKEESAYLLANDINKRRDEIFRKLPWTKTLSPARFGVLLNMSFQMGVDGLLGFKKTLEMIQKGQYTQAAKGMMNSKWARQTPARALRLSIQMRTDQWQ